MIEKTSIDVSFTRNKVNSENVIGLLLTEYPILINPNRETPYGLSREDDKSSEVQLLGYSPLPSDTRYAENFRTNPLSNPEVARLFAKNSDWILFRAPRRQSIQGSTSTRFSRSFKYSDLADMVISESKEIIGRLECDLSTDTTVLKGIDKSVRLWEGQKPYLNEVSLIWTEDRGSSPRDIKFSGGLLTEGLPNSRKPALNRQDWKLDFEVNIGGFLGPNCEISEYKRKLSTNLNVSESLRGLNRRFNRAETGEIVRDAINATRAHLGSESRQFDFVYDPSNTISVGVSLDLHSYSKDTQEDIGMRKAYVDGLVALEILDTAIYNLVERAIQKESLREAENLDSLRERLASEGIGH